MGKVQGGNSWDPVACANLLIMNDFTGKVFDANFPQHPPTFHHLIPFVAPKGISIKILYMSYLVTTIF